MVCVVLRILFMAVAALGERWADFVAVDRFGDGGTAVTHQVADVLDPDAAVVAEDGVGLEYSISSLICAFGVCRFGHAVHRYSLVIPSRIGLRRIRWPARSIGSGGLVSAWAGASWPRDRCGRAALKCAT